MSLLRAFIALDIPVQIQSSIHEATSSIRGEIGPLVKWVRIGSMHLTLKFLGDVSPVGLDALTQMLRTEADACQPFDLLVGGLGSFPSPKRARVIFIGIQAPACPEPGRRDGLEALYRVIESACTRLGYEPETRGYSPHLTIGRVRQNISPHERQKIRGALEAATIDSLGTARVDSVKLYKSELQPDGAAYTKLFSAQLNSLPQRRGDTEK